MDLVGAAETTKENPAEGKSPVTILAGAEWSARREIDRSVPR